MGRLSGKEVVIFDGFWDSGDCHQNPTWLFVFGDNDIGRGIGGQAVIRNCPNAMGIPTKKFPTNDDNAFYDDADLEMNKRNIHRAISRIKRAMYGPFTALVLPSAGLGTGLAQLNTRAPLTFEYLQEQLEALMSEFGSKRAYTLD